jgi:hypothetical protein
MMARQEMRSAIPATRQEPPLLDHVLRSNIGKPATEEQFLIEACAGSASAFNGNQPID